MSLENVPKKYMETLDQIMKRALKFVFLFQLMVCFGGVASAEAMSSYLLCRFDKSVRSVRVEIDNGSCTATYTKAGVDEVVAKSSSSEVCNRVAKSIRSNLERGNWKCKDVSQSRISTSEQ